MKKHSVLKSIPHSVMLCPRFCWSTCLDKKQGHAKYIHRRKTTLFHQPYIKKIKVWKEYFCKKSCLYEVRAQLFPMTLAQVFVFHTSLRQTKLRIRLIMTMASGDSFSSPTASPNSLGVRAAVELEVNLDSLGPSLSPVLAFSIIPLLAKLNSSSWSSSSACGGWSIIPAKQN